MIHVLITPQDYVLADLLSSLEAMSSKILPKTYRAVKASAAVIQYTWKAYALGAPIPGSTMRVKRPTGAYAKSIKVRMLSPFFQQVVTDYPPAEGLETGVKAKDLKKTHPYGPRSRVSAAGVPFNIIPFRHGTPGSLIAPPMPQKVYERIRQEIKNGTLQLSQVNKGKKTTPNYHGDLIPRARYAWGSRISSGVQNLEGMVAFDVSTPGSTRTEYMTFRVISKNSPSFKWIQAARPGMHMTQHVVANTKDIINEIISQGIKEDLGLA